MLSAKLQPGPNVLIAIIMMLKIAMMMLIIIVDVVL